MSVENGFIRHKKHIKQENGTYKSISYWTSSNSVEMDSGNTLQEEFDLIDIQTSNDGTCPGSIDGGGLKLEVTGNTYQKTLSGKNLIGDVYTADYIRYDSKYGTLTCTTPTNTTDSYVKVQKVINTEWVGTARSRNSIGRWICDITKDETFNKLYIGFNGNIVDGILKLDVSHLENGKTYYIQMCIDSLEANAGVISNIMITTNPEYDDTYEPYCGGTPSPNPDYPQAIENVGDCVEMVQGTLDDKNNGVETSHTMRVRSRHFIPCKSGDNVQIQTDSTSLFIMVFYYNESGYVSNSRIDNANLLEATIPSGVTKFKFVIAKDTNITPQTVGKISLTVNGKHVVQIVEHGKNLLKNTAVTQTVDGLSFTVNDDKSITISGTATKNIYYVINDNFVFESNNEYKISGCRGGSSVSYMIGCVDNNYTVHYWDDGKGTILKNINKNYKIVFFAYAGTKVNTTIYPMITLNTETDQSYEPYTEKVATIFLDEPLREWDRLVKVDGVWNVERKLTTNTIDSNISWAFSETESVKRIYSTISFNVTKQNRYLRCNQANCIGSVYELSTSLNSAFIVYDTATRVCFTFDWLQDMSTTAEVQEYIKNLETPIEIVYELATPTLTPLDTESQLALNGLVTFDGVTYLEVDSKIKPSGIEVEYGTSKVSGIALKNELRHDTQDIIIAEQNAKIEELTTALLMLNQE